jgi:hypothetical protein
MYRIERRSYGLKLTIEGSIDAEEAPKFLEEYRAMLSGNRGDIGLLIDCARGLPLSPDALFFLASTYREGRMLGVMKVAFVMSSPALREQIQRTFEKGGALGDQRFIDAENPNSERIALDWLENGIEP